MSQICTAFTTLGVEPPSIDVWDFGLHDGSVTEVLPPLLTGFSPGSPCVPAGSLDVRS
jgi:hypothetical protein